MTSVHRLSSGHQDEPALHAARAQSVVVRYSLYGDGNLDGVVDIDNDFNLFLAGLDYTAGQAGLNSLSLRVAAEPRLTAPEAAVMQWMIAAVPEPAGLGLSALGSLSLVRRRRRT